MHRLTQLFTRQFMSEKELEQAVRGVCDVIIEQFRHWHDGLLAAERQPHFRMVPHAQSAIANVDVGST